MPGWYSRKQSDYFQERKTVRNTATGEERMSVGHTIGDRTHVIEKKRDRDGRIREQQRFVNLDQGSFYSDIGVEGVWGYVPSRTSIPSAKTGWGMAIFST